VFYTSNRTTVGARVKKLLKGRRTTEDKVSYKAVFLKNALKDPYPLPVAVAKTSKERESPQAIKHALLTNKTFDVEYLVGAIHQ
jgi:hypothetical protein